MRQILLFGLSITAAIACADVDSALGNFFEGLDYHTHVSQPSAYKGQAANYYSGGRLFARSTVMDVTPAQITLPKINAGCGGIDLFMGGFSHINADQLVALGKAIIADAIPFGVDLALQTWAPQIKAIRDQLQTVADRYLNQSINSCEAAQAGLSGLAGFAGVGSQKYICEAMGTQNNSFADWVAAQQGCGAGGQADSQLDQARNDPVLKAMVKKRHNVVWSILLKNTFLAEDAELAEFFQATSGTLIYDEHGHIRTYGSLLTDNNNLVNALLSGGEATIYRCDDTGVDRCLHLHRGTVKISPAQGLQTKIEVLLTRLIRKLQSDQPLSDHEKSFLEYTTLPVLKLFISSIEVGEIPPVVPYARMIAVDLIETYLNQVLFVVQQSLNGSQHDPADLALLTSNLRQAKRFLNGLADKARQTVLTQQALISNTRKIEQEIEGALSVPIARSLHFSG